MDQINCIEIRPDGSDPKQRMFTLTNGIDSIHAAYVYATGRGDDKVAAHWDVEGDGLKLSLFKPKEEVITFLTSRLTTALTVPLSEADARKLQARDGFVHGIVSVKLSDLLGLGADAFRAAVIGKLLKTPPTQSQDFAYQIVAVNPAENALNIRAQVILGTGG